MKYLYQDFVERRDLSNVIEASIPVLQDAGIDPNAFYQYIIENPEALDNPELLTEAPWSTAPGNNPNWWQRNAPNWAGGGGEAAGKTWNHNRKLGGQKAAIDQAMRAYGGAKDANGNPNPRLPPWLKRYATEKHPFDKLLNFDQERAKEKVQGAFGGSLPTPPPTAYPAANQPGAAGQPASPAGTNAMSGSATPSLRPPNSALGTSGNNDTPSLRPPHSALGTSGNTPVGTPEQQIKQLSTTMQAMNVQATKLQATVAKLQATVDQLQNTPATSAADTAKSQTQVTTPGGRGKDATNRPSGATL